MVESVVLDNGSDVSHSDRLTLLYKMKDLRALGGSVDPVKDHNIKSKDITKVKIESGKDVPESFVSITYIPRKSTLVSRTYNVLNHVADETTGDEPVDAVQRIAEKNAETEKRILETEEDINTYPKKESIVGKDPEKWVKKDGRYVLLNKREEVPHENGDEYTPDKLRRMKLDLANKRFAKNNPCGTSDDFNLGAASEEIRSIPTLDGSERPVPEFLFVASVRSQQL